jgi:hypothetical protein
MQIFMKITTLSANTEGVYKPQPLDYQQDSQAVVCFKKLDSVLFRCFEYICITRHTSLYGLVFYSIIRFAFLWKN